MNILTNEMISDSELKKKANGSFRAVRQHHNMNKSNHSGSVKESVRCPLRQIISVKINSIMFKKSLLILLTALGLLGALSAQAAPKPPPITISSLPFTITTPGTYVLTGNLTYTGASGNAISINGPIAGSVVLDFKGFTITGGGIGGGVGIGGNGGLGGSVNTFPITVRNGIIQNFQIGVSVSNQSDITIDHNVFNLPAVGSGNDAIGVQFDVVNSSIVSNCTFNGITGLTYGILETGGVPYHNSYGNSYNNDTFSQLVVPIFVENQAPGTIALNNCQFAAPPVSPTLGLTSNITAQAAPKKWANITISTLPFTITAPGTYVLTGNLTAPSDVAILISPPIAGSVVLDLKGFTLTGSGSGLAVDIYTNGPGTQYPITIQNGTISNFSNGISANGTEPPPPGQGHLFDITINNIVFNISNDTTTYHYGITFTRVDSSIISNCTFSGGVLDYGIWDVFSNGGNTYKNDTFTNIDFQLFVENFGGNIPTILNSCQFVSPPKKP